MNISRVNTDQFLGTPQNKKVTVRKINEIIDKINSLDTLSNNTVTVESFGAIGNGLTDDTNAINGAADFARLNNTSLTFNSSTTYLTSSPIFLQNLTINANNATIQTNNSNSLSDPTAVKVIGTISSYYPISLDVNKYESVVQISISDLISSGIKKGDLIKIISDSLFASTSGEGVKQGEIQKVYDIDFSTGKIFIYGYLEDTYLISNTSRLCKVNSTYFTTNGILNIIQDGSTGSTGIELQYTENINAELKVTNALSISVNLGNSWAADIKIKSYGSNQTGTGYGVILSNCTMYSKVTGTVQGARHSITAGGDSNSLNARAHGVSWGNIIYDMTCSDEFAAQVYDSHSSCGSLIFENCIAINGKTYDGSTLTTSAFKTDCRNITIKNCKALGLFANFLSIITVDPKRIYIENCSYNGAANGITFSSISNTELISINGFNGISDIYNGVGSLIFIAGTHTNISFSNLKGYNTGGVCIGISASLPEIFSISNFDLNYSSQQTSLTSNLLYIRSTMTTIRLINCSSKFANYQVNSAEVINTFESIGGNCINANSGIHSFSKLITNFTLTGGLYTEIVNNGYLALFTLGVGRVSLNGGIIAKTGTHLRGIYALAATQFTSFSNIGTDLTLTSGVLFTNSMIPTISVTSNPSLINKSSTIVTSNVSSMIPGTSYISNSASLLTFTLPTITTEGDIFSIEGLGAGKWKIGQLAGQTIKQSANTTTTGTGGSITAGLQYDSIEIKCIVANTTFIITAYTGTPVFV